MEILYGRNNKTTSRNMQMRKKSHRPSLQVQRVLGKNSKIKTQERTKKTNGTSKKEITRWMK